MAEFLSSTLGQLTMLVASWSALTGGVWTLSSRAESITSKEAKTRAAEWLHSVDVGRPFNRLAESFSTAFDAVFGNRYLSWGFLLRSALASYVFTTALLLLYLALRGYPDSTAPTDMALVLLAIPFIANVIPDCLALIKTRYSINLARGGGGRRLVVVLLLDGVVSVFIGLAIATFVFNSFTDVQVFYTDSDEMLPVADTRSYLARLNDALPAMVTLNTFTYKLDIESGMRAEVTAPFSLGVWFYSTFLASAWLWLYAAAPFLVRAAEWTDIGWARFRWASDIEKHPFAALGAIIIGLLTVIYLIAVPLVILF